MPDELYFLVEIFSKNLKKWLSSRGSIENGMKILEIFGEIRLAFVENEGSLDLKNEFDWARKIKQPACKALGVNTKNEENSERFKEKLSIFEPHFEAEIAKENIFAKKVEM